MTMSCRALMLCAVLGAAARLDATVLIPVSLGELTHEAGAIVRGRVIAAEARFTPDRRAIETLVTMEAEATLKGSLGATVQFLVPGGTLGRYRSILVGAPAFAAGQHVVVFLGWTGPSYPYVLGLSQGVFRLAQTGGGDWMVTPPAVLPTMQGPIVRGNLSLRPTPLAEFEREVHALADGRQ